jgi:demethylmenaquinone methyltransferase/2-methoxy-6-polyprenyl-1,4-benzoquinol methylase
MPRDEIKTPELPTLDTEEVWQKHAWIYDPVVKILFLPFGGEGRFRKGFVDFAGVREGERVLDACCGSGALTSLLVERVGKTGAVSGIDLSPELLKIAAKRASDGLPVTFRQASCADIPFPDDSFDKIFVSFGMHEIAAQDRLSSLKQFNRVLKAEGSIFILEYHLPQAALARFTVKVFHRLFEEEEAYRMLLNGTLLQQLHQAEFSISRKRLIGAGMFQMLHAAKA